MVGNRAWSKEPTQGRVCTKWRPLNEESVYLIRDEERKREWVRRGERAGDKKREILLRLTNQRERGEGFKRFEGKQKWKKDRMKGWPERERKTHGKKQCAPLIRVKIQQTLRASRLAHLYCSEGGCLLAFVFQSRFRRLAFHGPSRISPMNESWVIRLQTTPSKITLTRNKYITKFSYGYAPHTLMKFTSPTNLFARDRFDKTAKESSLWKHRVVNTDLY